MAREILGEYGPEASTKGPRATTGGIKSAKDVREYKPPKGPTSINNPQSPGLHGEAHHCGSQGKH